MRRFIIFILTRCVKVLRNQYTIKRITRLIYYINFLTYHRKINKLKHVEISQIQTLSKKICYFSNEYYKENAIYGISHSINSFCNNKKPIAAIFEHGAGLGDFVNPIYATNSGLPAIITLSDYRYEIIRKKCDKPVFRIGPFIHYAVEYYDQNKFLREKKKLGKNLLIFPAHSTFRVFSQYDIDWFIDECLKFASNFDSITACLYWQDILNGKDKYYRKRGFNVVTAGHKHDYMFLSRLKTIIKLSDYTISNAIGTHIGYCIYLNKPHLILKQKVEYTGTPKAIKAEFEERFNNLEWTISYNELVHKFHKTFGEFHDTITRQQYDLCSYMWGFNHLKTEKELQHIIEICNHIVHSSVNKTDKQFIETANSVIFSNNTKNQLLREALI